MFLLGKKVVGLTARSRYTSSALGTTSIYGANIVGANLNGKKKEKLRVESNTFAKKINQFRMQNCLVIDTIAELLTINLD